jgi:hypothetical protein
VLTVHAVFCARLQVGLLNLFCADIKPITVAASSPADVYAAALDAAQAMPRWEILAQQEPGSSSSSVVSFQAVATTKAMRFKDDIVVRLTQGEGGRTVVVDVRSRSRVGQVGAAFCIRMVTAQCVSGHQEDVLTDGVQDTSSNSRLKRL